MLSSETPPPPATFEEAVDYLRVADMRQLLTELGAMPERGRPRKRAEFIAMLSTIGEVAAIIEKAMPRYHGALDKRKTNRERHKESLLAHTISMRTYSLRDQQNDQRLRSSGIRSQILRPFESHCPVEREYAARFMAGKIKGHPPFFLAIEPHLYANELMCELTGNNFGGSDWVCLCRRRALCLSATPRPARRRAAAGSLHFPPICLAVFRTARRPF